jgi:hypothetical protein
MILNAGWADDSAGTSSESLLVGLRESFGQFHAKGVFNDAAALTFYFQVWERR